MKKRMKRIFTILLAVMAIFAFSAVPAFASDTTSTGDGEVTATVPVEGSISALTISVTHPATITYAIDPNDGDTGSIVTPEILLVNNTLAPVNVMVQSISSASGGTIQFADVLPAEKDWANLNAADSKEFIALGIMIPSAMEWNVGYDQNTYYASGMSPTLFGSLNYNCMGVFTLVANHGLAFDQSYTAMHTLIFMFSLV